VRMLRECQIAKAHFRLDATAATRYSKPTSRRRSMVNEYLGDLAPIETEIGAVTFIASATSLTVPAPPLS
jgi:hypothetical protein